VIRAGAKLIQNSNISELIVDSQMQNYLSSTGTLLNHDEMQTEQ